MWENLKEKRNEGGFTLIELLIVIIILAILAAIVVFAVGTTTGNSKAAACNADAKSVETAVEAYKAQGGAYPSVGTAGQAQLTATGGSNGPWLRQWPVATVTTNGYAITLDPTTAGQVDVSTGGTATNFDAGGQALCNAL
jgi:general secretion pathway protein G